MINVPLVTIGKAGADVAVGSETDIVRFKICTVGKIYITYYNDRIL
jgi:hypothetical protein